MSIFKSIKGTFAAGIKSITGDTSKEEVHIGVARPTVNFDASAELLARYQDIWKELHENSEENAKKAEVVDTQITELYVKYDRQQEVMSRLHEGLGALPILVSQLQQATELLASLEGECEKLNTALVSLEDVIEEQELLTAQVIDTQKLSEYNQRKQDELENCRVQLARDHARKIQECEKRKKNLQKEREEAFQDAFEDDLEYFKIHGHVDKVSVTSSEGSKKMDIADFSFDEEDHENLDEFLGSTEVTPVNENLPESAEENENVFSEDDYIPKPDEESDFIKSGETGTSDSDMDTRQPVTSEQQQDHIQNWINNSNGGAKEECDKKDSGTVDGKKKDSKNSVDEMKDLENSANVNTNKTEEPS